MPHQDVYTRLALVGAIAPTAVGLNAVLRPSSAISMLGFPVPPQAVASGLAEALVQMYGSRSITLGLTSLVVLLFGDRKTLGWVCLTGAPLAAIDGYASYRFMGSGQWGHWIFVPFSLGMAGGLLGWY